MFGYSLGLLNFLLPLFSLPPVTSLTPLLLSPLLWAQITVARARGGENSRQECGTSVFRRTIPLFSYSSALQQTVSGLHSRKRNRGPLNPTPPSKFSSSLPPFFCLSPHPSFPFCRPHWSFPRTPPPLLLLFPFSFLLHFTKQKSPS